MSHFDYQASRQIAAEGYPFYALIMAAYRHADTDNAIRLEQKFPDTCRELRERYNAPGGRLPSELDTLPRRRVAPSATSARTTADEDDWQGDAPDWTLS